MSLPSKWDPIFVVRWPLEWELLLFSLLSGVTALKRLMLCWVIIWSRPVSVGSGAAAEWLQQLVHWSVVAAKGVYMEQRPSCVGGVVSGVLVFIVFMEVAGGGHVFLVVSRVDVTVSWVVALAVVEGACSGLPFVVSCKVCACESGIGGVMSVEEGSCSGLTLSVLSKVCCCESGIGRKLSIVGASVGRGIAVVTGAMAGVAVL